MAVPALLALTAFSIGSSIYGGQQANKAAGQEAVLQRQQAAIAQEEANRDAGIHADERTQFLKRQKLAFLKSGVTLEGSPLLVLEDTQRKSQEEVDAMIRRGNAQYRLGNASADITESKGRAALIGAYGTAASTGASAIFNASKAVA